MKLIWIETEGSNSKVTLGKTTNVNDLNKSGKIQKYLKDNQIVINVSLTKIK